MLLGSGICKWFIYKNPYYSLYNSINLSLSFFLLLEEINRGIETPSFMPPATTNKVPIDCFNPSWSLSFF